MEKSKLNMKREEEELSLDVKEGVMLKQHPFNRKMIQVLVARGKFSTGDSVQIEKWIPTQIGNSFGAFRFSVTKFVICSCLEGVRL